MSSAVVFRRPKSVGSGASPRRNIGRPKSWTEFNTKFQTLSNPVNIDISPTPSAENNSVVVKRPSNNYRKVRPLSASFLDLPRDDNVMNQSPISPNYTSLLTPYPWRSNGRKLSPVAMNDNGQLNHNYDSTNFDYDVTKNSVKWKTEDENTPEAKLEHENSESSDPELKQIAFSSDSDSIDSAVVVSGECTPYATSLEKSPRRRQIESEVVEGYKPLSVKYDTTHPDYQSASSSHAETDESPDVDGDSRSTSGSSDTSSSSSFNQPQIVISGQKRILGMEFFPDEDVIHFEESPIARFDRRSIVPSPLKSCYSPVATYDDLVEYSDFENTSGEENSAPELTRHNNVTLHGRDGTQPGNDVTLDKQGQSQKLRVYNFPDDDTKDNLKNQRDVTKKLSAKRRNAPEKKVEEDIDFDEIMRKFKKSKEEHLESLKWIYADSSRKVHDLLDKLKDTMTENGYLEWYPRVR